MGQINNQNIKITESDKPDVLLVLSWLLYSLTRLEALPDLPLNLHEVSLPEDWLLSQNLFSQILCFIWGALMITVEENTSLTNQKLPLILVLKASIYVPSQFL